MPEFSGIKKEDHERLGEAARMYGNLTGKDLTGVVSGIPVVNQEEDAKVKQQREQERFQREAAATREVEDADQRARRLRNQRDAGEVQPENPGPGQPAMITERAKAQGMSRAGEEPEIARRGRGR